MTAAQPWWAPPRSIKWLLVVYLCGMLTVIAFPPVVRWFGLASPIYDPPTRILAVFTYPFVISGLKPLGQVAFLTWLPAVVLRGRMEERAMLLALVAGALVGGLTFGVVTSNKMLIGGGLAAWGLMGASLVVSLRARELFRGWRRAYQVAVGLLLIITTLAGTAYNVAILASALAGGASALVRFERGISEATAADLA